MDDRHYQYLDKINSPADLKRVPKAAPGYVIYHTNYSIMVEPKKEI